ncbi:iron-binding protein [Phaeobacter gallaeciensis]|uniref:Iron-binding protein n=2 Tax=Roseobacteraceae TaxID=2854170 RepID=A0A366WSY4_9RHOB|nr:MULTISPECIES: CDGSH iron-sulfur domain-containing protein [Roseobacteraceae]MBT3143105.1 CDGSH iron-sulfur domain-containing protein [Falsiruegeria litorea]MBT8166795.1 CDGSH iron-sulfur domain-containing protein [Falsiruegeria litorea]RBW51639.1 iron-binding protein [Phaeobacter gallaeciensis]
MSKTESNNISVQFDGKKCIHARRCVLGLPMVFQPGTKGGWIFPENANAEEIARVIDSCPSGALTYDRHDGGVEESMPRVNTSRICENGPNEIRGDIRIPGEEPRKRVLLCRCGASKNKPFCDNSHNEASFVATGEVGATDNTATLEGRDGPLDVNPIKNGPVRVAGNLEITAGSGRSVATGQKFSLCRCGASGNKPFCDGSHAKVGFEAD